MSSAEYAREDFLLHFRTIQTSMKVVLAGQSADGPNECRDRDRTLEPGLVIPPLDKYGKHTGRT